MMPLYDRVGIGYAHPRRPDPRIHAAILDALGGAAPIVNVGAGAGSYEPRDRRVVAVEPSATMVAQRPPGAARPVRDALARLAGDLTSGTSSARRRASPCDTSSSSRS